MFNVLQSTKNAELQRKRVLQELGSMLRVQHHPHAVRLLNAYEDDMSYQVIMPLLKGGSLLTRLSGCAAAAGWDVRGKSVQSVAAVRLGLQQQHRVQQLQAPWATAPLPCLRSSG